MHHPRLGDSRAIGTPLKLSATPLEPTRRAPMLSEHTDEMLAAAGYSPDEIEQLRARARHGRITPSMPRYVAFLRGVMPMNAKMPDLRRAFAAAGFSEVRTVISSGNVVFNATGSEATVARKAEKAMDQTLGRIFPAFVRSVPALQELLDADPYAPFRLPADAKRIVTFLRTAPTTPLKLPIVNESMRMLATTGREVFSAYTPHPKAPEFMMVIEKTLGKDVTTRTWATVQKCVKA